MRWSLSPTVKLFILLLTKTGRSTNSFKLFLLCFPLLYSSLRTYGITVINRGCVPVFFLYHLFVFARFNKRLTFSFIPSPFVPKQLLGKGVVWFLICGDFLAFEDSGAAKFQHVKDYWWRTNPSLCSQCNCEVVIRVVGVILWDYYDPSPKGRLKREGTNKASSICVLWWCVVEVKAWVVALAIWLWYCEAVIRQAFATFPDIVPQTRFWRKL